jgi:hypothetical protein
MGYTFLRAAGSYAFLLGLALGSFQLAAQADSTAFRPLTHLGVQYGQSWNEVNFSPAIPQGFLAGQRLAAVLRYVGERHLGVQLEVAYDQRGWAEVQAELSTRYTRRIDYLDLAIFSHLSVGGGAVRPFVLLGSYLSYPIGETETIPADWQPDRQAYYGIPLPERLQYGLAAGLGLEVVLGPVSLQLDGRYRSSLGGIFSTNNSSFTFSNGRGLSAQVSLLVRVF